MSTARKTRHGIYIFVVRTYVITACGRRGEAEISILITLVCMRNFSRIFFQVDEICKELGFFSFVFGTPNPK